MSDERAPAVATWVSALVLGVLLLVVWLVAAFLVLRLPPAWGIPWLLGVGLLFLWLHVWRPRARHDRRRLNAYRVRQLRDRATFLRLGLPALLMAGAALTWLLALLVGPEVLEVAADSEAWGAIDAYAGTPLGWIAIALLVAVVVPIIEEFYFRGLIQRSLERRFGIVAAIVVSALLFGLVHMHPWPWMLQPFGMGLLWGYAAWATRSIWASVAAHGAWNGAGLLLGSLQVSGEYDAWRQPALTRVMIALLAGGGALTFVAWRRVERRTTMQDQIA